MTVRAISVVANDNQQADRSISWAGLANGDSGAPWLPSFSERRISAQALGTFGVAGSVQLEGSNDGGTTWAVLKDLNGNACLFTAAGLVAMPEPPAQLRPNVTAGDGTTSLKIALQVRRG